MKTFWIVLSITGSIIAAILVFRENYDAAFVVAAGSAVCLFLNYRQQLREKLPKEEEPDDEESDEEVPS